MASGAAKVGGEVAEMEVKEGQVGGGSTEMKTNNVAMMTEDISDGSMQEEEIEMSYAMATTKKKKKVDISRWKEKCEQVQMKKNNWETELRLPEEIEEDLMRRTITYRSFSKKTRKIEEASIRELEECLAPLSEDLVFKIRGATFASVEARFRSKERAILFAAQTLESGEWTLFPTYCGKRVIKMIIKGLSPEIETVWAIGSALLGVEDVIILEANEEDDGDWVGRSVEVLCLAEMETMEKVSDWITVKNCKMKVMVMGRRPRCYRCGEFGHFRSCCGRKEAMEEVTAEKVVETTGVVVEAATKEKEKIADKKVDQSTTEESEVVEMSEAAKVVAEEILTTEEADKIREEYNVQNVKDTEEPWMTVGRKKKKRAKAVNNRNSSEERMKESKKGKMDGNTQVKGKSDGVYGKNEEIKKVRVAIVIKELKEVYDERMRKDIRVVNVSEKLFFCKDGDVVVMDEEDWLYMKGVHGVEDWSSGFVEWEKGQVEVDVKDIVWVE